MFINIDPLVIPCWIERRAPKDWASEEGFDWLDSPDIKTLEDAIAALDDDKNSKDVMDYYDYIQKACSIINQMEEVINVSYVGEKEKICDIENDNVPVVAMCNSWPTREEVERYCGVWLNSYGEIICIDIDLLLANPVIRYYDAYSTYCRVVRYGVKIESIPKQVVDKYFEIK